MKNTFFFVLESRSTQRLTDRLTQGKLITTLRDSLSSHNGGENLILQVLQTIDYSEEQDIATRHQIEVSDGLNSFLQVCLKQELSLTIGYLTPNSIVNITGK